MNGVCGVTSSRSRPPARSRARRRCDRPRRCPGRGRESAAPPSRPARSFRSPRSSTPRLCRWQSAFRSPACSRCTPRRARARRARRRRGSVGPLRRYRGSFDRLPVRPLVVRSASVRPGRPGAYASRRLPSPVSSSSVPESARNHKGAGGVPPTVARLFEPQPCRGSRSRRRPPALVGLAAGRGERAPGEPAPEAALEHPGPLSVSSRAGRRVVSPPRTGQRTRAALKPLAQQDRARC